MTGSAIYDAGMLIGLANRASRAQAEHLAIIRHTRPIVPGPVLSQAWRRHSPAQAILSRYLKDCQVLTDYREQDYKRIGVMLGDAALPAKSRPDVVDALVALTAARNTPASVLTSDPADIAAYLATLRDARVIVVPI